MEKEDEIFYHYLSKEAADRFSRIKAVDADRANSIRTVIISDIKKGKINTQITEGEFLKFANAFSGEEKKEFNFARRKSYLDF